MALRTLLAVCLLAVLAGCPGKERSLGPVPAPTPGIAGLLREGERLLDADENQRAWETFAQARARAETTGDRAGRIAALVGMGDADPPQTDGKAALAALAQALALSKGAQAESVRAHLELRQGARAARRQELAQSVEHLERALAAARRAGDRRMEARSLNALGNIHFYRDELPQAAERFQAAARLARAIGYRPVEGFAEHTLGDVENKLGHPAEALRHYETALAIMRACSNRRVSERILNAIGALYLDQGDYGKALHYFQEALRTGTDDRSEVAYVLNNLGVIFGQVNSDLALAHFHKSLRIAEEIGDDYGKMRVLNNLGVSSLGHGEHEHALGYFSRALHLAEQAKDRQAIAGDWHSLAITYQAQGRLDLAGRAYRKSLAVAESFGDRSLVGQALGGLADLHLARKEYTAAVDLADRAAAVALETGYRESLWQARTCAGRALRALGRPAAARRAFDDAIATVEEVRGHGAGGLLGREGYLESRFSPYQGRIELAADEGNAAEALGQAERAKGRTLLETLREGRTEPASTLTPVQRTTEQRLRDRLGSLNSEILRVHSGAARGADSVALAGREQARRELEAFTARLYGERSELRLRRADFPAWSLESARGLLDAGSTALIEYTVLDDRTYLWTVTADAADSPVRVRLHRLPVGSRELATQVEAFRRKLGARDLDVQAAARRLYDLVLAPAAAELRGKKALRIVPDGALWDLPFQALQPSASEVLPERWALSYAPSLGFLAELATRKARPSAAERAPTLLAVGDPELTGETASLTAPLRGASSLARLPEAGREVRALANLYGPGRSAVYTAAQASEARVKAEAGKFRVLHFATHAFLDDRHPLYSSLLLAQSSPAQREDGLLEAWEILDLPLDADLVVLSACQTARGRPTGGEGMIGLSWALAAAGSAATLASQWEVDSASTGELMVEFHREWLAGASKAEALRRAALAIRKQPRYRHPFYWAPFVLVGDGT